MLAACFFTILGVVLPHFLKFCFRFVLLLLLCHDGISFYLFAWHVVIVHGVVYFFVAFRTVFPHFLFCFILGSFF
jgi:hypothetical protein